MGWLQGALLALGVVLLGYCGYVVLDTWVFQARESAALARFTPELPAAGDLAMPPIGPDGLIGRIEIPVWVLHDERDQYVLLRQSKPQRVADSHPIMPRARERRAGRRQAVAHGG